MTVTTRDLFYFDVTGSARWRAACASIAVSGIGSDTPAAAVLGKHGGVRGAELLPQFANGDGTFSFSGDRNIDAVLIGSRWTSSLLTYTFPTDGDYGPTTFGAGQLQFNEQQQDAAREGFRLISSYTGLVIVEVAPDQAETATFRLSQTVSDSVGSAQGGFPGYVGGEGGDIWFGRSEQPYYETPQRGNWGYSTMLHEIGHTMGLKHGQDDYSSEDLGFIFEDGGSIFGTRALEYGKDGQAWSLMTYTGGPDGVPNFQGEGANQAQTYMQFDIAALQYLYGANFTTLADDTVYRWDAVTGQGFVNGIGRGVPTASVVFETIWDGGGTDTYDLSDYAGGMTVDLRPGAFSTFSVAQRADNNALSGVGIAAPGNIANALLYQGDVRSLIENAIGGAGDDRLIGNQVANVLAGGGGNDVLAGGAGSDTLIGGAGDDIADFTGATSGIALAIDRSATDLRVVNGVDTDVLSSIEGVVGTAFDDRLTGDNGENMLSGGAGGRDVLVGGAGNDTLIGGGYVLAYRDEADIVRGVEPVNRSIASAISLDGSFEMVPRDGVATNAAYPGAVLPHATVVAAAAGSEGMDYYAFTATAGARALFDIDATNNYTGLEVVDTAGNVLAANYFEATSDDGSQSGYDARLAYTFQDSGTFYIRVTGSSFSATPRDLRADQRYTLAVSLENAVVAAPVIRSTGSAVLDGGLGDDRLVATAGDDRLGGGAGRDTVSYENHFRAVAVDLSIVAAQDTGAGRDTIVGVENLTGTRFADRLTGNGGINVIDGGGGNDTIDGGAGIDTLSFASQAAAVSVSLAMQENAQIYRLGQTLTATGFENLTGSMGADTLVGDGRTNVITGGEGDDILMVDALGRVGARDQLIGGTGSDTASFAPFGAAIVAGLKDDGTGFVTSGVTAIANLREIENLIGGTGADRLTGNAGANILTGGGGGDRLVGAGGDDRIEGGSGDDLIDGGAGIDTAVFAGSTNTTIDLRNTRAQQSGHGRDRLLGIENLETGSGNDQIDGNDGDNLFIDGGGNDRYDGHGGVDTLSFTGATGGVTVDLSITDTQDTGVRGTKQIAGIEALIGGTIADYLAGSAGANAIDGGTGDDILVGGLGRDSLTGGEGDDALVGDTLGLADGTDAASSSDTLSGGAGSDIILGGVGSDVLDGGDGNDTLSNGSFASTVITSGSTLLFDRGLLIRSDGGDDQVDGGSGEDFAILSYNGRKESILVDVRDPTVRSVILSNGVAAGSIVNVEKLGFEGGDGDDTVYGGAGYDFIATYGGNDFVDAGLGDDVVYGGSGYDVFDGGGGYDVINFTAATSAVTFDLLRTDAQNSGGAGIIAARNFEAIAASGYGDTLYLTDKADNITDDGAGDDSFYARGGDDRIFVLRYGSDASSILLDGGDGDDDLSLLAFVDGVHSITFNAGAGDDLIVAVGALRVVADGGSGDDYFGLQIGGLAGEYAFTVTMGSGADRLYFNVDALTATVARTDTVITDFSASEDILQLTSLLEEQYDSNYEPYHLLSNYGVGDDPFRTGHFFLTQSGTSTLVEVDRDGVAGPAEAVTILTLENVLATTLTAKNFITAPIDYDGFLVVDPTWAFVAPTLGTDVSETLSGSDGRDRLYALAGDDTLFGSGGDDVLRGGDGADRISGGAGQDLLYGDAGEDIFLFASATDADGDAIRDFTTGDRIDLSAIGAEGAFTWNGDAAFGGIAGQLRVTLDTNGFSIVSGDVDGDGTEDFRISTLTDHVLAATDFLL